MTLQQSGNPLAEGLPPTIEGRTDQPPYRRPSTDPSLTVWPLCPCIFAVGVPHTGDGAAASRVRAVATTRVTAVRHVLDDQRRQPRKHHFHKRIAIRPRITITNGYSASSRPTGQARSFDNP